MTDPKPPTPFAVELGRRLRAARMQMGLSLNGVEEKSRGRWKAVVIGTWERGDRRIGAQKLTALALFYQVPVGELLAGLPVEETAA